MESYDQSLDAIISAKKKARARGRGRGRGSRFQRNTRGLKKRSPFRARGFPNRRSNPGNINVKWQHDMFLGGSNRTSSGGTKLQISNLDFGVSDADIEELFSEFGFLKRFGVNYDSTGRSRGIAEVVYGSAGSAKTAYNTYNGVPLDGRPMKIELVGSQAKSDTFKPIRLRGRGGRGGRRGSGRGRGGWVGRKQALPTADELNADLDAYNTNS